MPEFVMTGASAPAFKALDAFTQGYIEALFFTEEEQLCEESGREMPSVAFNLATMESRFVGGDSPGFADLAPRALERIQADCATFQRDHAALLEEAYATGYEAEQAGRDFWYTRNGHGVGFTDRECLEPASAEYEAASDELTAHCAAWTDPDDKAASAKWSEIVGRKSALKEQSIGHRLYMAARHSTVDAYIGDDGKVYLS